ncbi:hypothetical protein [Tautonia plasticadhaerens]|uniref:Uncharacterized protein n=1 Tax=Tautonia plasticadhaerens TaxID=2527974 RepID=A0A518GYI4_9BACT|nr:hypothetical protein [Tautonia plasticadhaerens]QDV33659.1 hypothetical protein ElP_15350 [Tautonia plasticadhaerens]
MTRRMIATSALVLGLAFAFGGVARPASAQDWTSFYHWPYVPPQVPGNGVQTNQLYDGWYLYPKEMRIVPQIQGPYYRNFYGGKKHLGLDRMPHWLHDWSSKKKYYQGHHFALDVF